MEYAINAVFEFGLTVKKIRSTAYQLAKTENKQNQLSGIAMASKWWGTWFKTIHTLMVVKSWFKLENALFTKEHMEKKEKLTQLLYLYMLLLMVLEPHHS